MRWIMNPGWFVVIVGAIHIFWPQDAASLYRLLAVSSWELRGRELEAPRSGFMVAAGVLLVAVGLYFGFYFGLTGV